MATASVSELGRRARGASRLLATASGAVKDTTLRLAADLLEQHRADIMAATRDRLAHYKWPRSIDFDAQLPRLDNGKLYKTALRDRYWEGRSSRVV